MQELNDFDDSYAALLKEKADDEALPVPVPSNSRGKGAAASAKESGRYRAAIVPQRDSDDEFGDADLEFAIAANDEAQSRKKQRKEAHAP